MNLTPDSKVLIQGITQPLAAYYAARMKAYGTNLVAGISVGNGRQELYGIPVFDLVEEAISECGFIDTTIIFVEPYSVLDAALEAIDAGISQIIVVTGDVPPLDMVNLLRIAKVTGTLIIGPSSSGIIVPGKILLGTQESEFYTPGVVGLISRTSFLTYEVALALNQAQIGQSIGINLGSDSIVGSSFRQWLDVLATDKTTKAIVLVDQTGGSNEEATAEYIAKTMNKPVVVYIAGYSTPEDKQLGDPSSIIAAQLSGPITIATTSHHKVEVYKEAKVPVAQRPSQIPKLVKKLLKKG
ncbi:MAG TPA: CoA-binding protein [Cyanobacteria bacterium UBA11149]|nr:CoA-binding protein [Cyanobacteria bacterium UBA11367]HBE58349.1 CoA-binding protein [Cyanobacteria bacterium UBA11366]HBK62054.1 CoA-binding protein [Cyanobacteria bacterium UBA11166]HBR73886.1 CoA-binding protein [Cyanobacteria bacterium UBA11159]HBS71198.1 CoA-binding protein [Cyanobacteria bacterium UBA11153]HBW89250.1 CoA-binding protein [Cyanobacteria bacterium UBA11149]HCA94698.1 CoA-binding protein [Cyanobacteria bacterium UBA9226]